MRRLIMRPIELTTVHGPTRIEGGWTLEVPEVEPIGADLIVLRRALIEEAGDPMRAERMARDALGTEYIQARIRNVRLSVRHFAQQYARMWPKLVKFHTEHGERVATLIGFDPAQAARLYWPNENTGRRGKEFGKSFLREMGRRIA